MPLRLLFDRHGSPWWMFRGCNYRKKRPFRARECFAPPPALNRWLVGDVDQAIRRGYGDPIDTLDCGQTGNGQWQDRGRWLSDGWRRRWGRSFRRRFNSQAPTVAALALTAQPRDMSLDEETRKPRNRMDCLKSPITMPILPIPVNKPPSLPPSYAMRSNPYV